MPPPSVPEPSPALRAAPLMRVDDSFQRLVDSVRDYAIFMLTAQGAVASWNVGAQRIMGYAADEVIGRHFSLFYPPEAIAAGWPPEELRRAEAFGRVEDEGWRVRRDGSRFWADTILSPVRGDAGELLGFSKVTRDLSERRAHEQQLAESERNQRLLVESVRDYAIFRLSPEGLITSWNRGAEHIKGYSAAEVIGRHFSLLYRPEDIARGWPEEELRRAARDSTFEDEGWRVRKDGSLLWANVIITALHGDDGALVGYAKVTRDLTERRQHEEVLRQREENLRLLVEGVRDHAMFLLDQDGRIRTWNAGAQRLLGYTAEQAIGQPTTLIYTHEDLETGQFQAALNAVQTRGHLEFEAWRQRADGSRFLAGISATEVRDERGQARGFVQIIRDLTDRRRIEVLETEGRRIGDFIAMLSHELRNPLAPIRNAVAILKKFAGGQPETAWCAELIERQTTHMARLVDDLLDVSRVTSGKIRLERALLALDAVVEEAVESMRPVVQAHGHALVLRLPAKPLSLDGDATRLTQVLVNLLANAAKYTPAPGHIEVTLAREEHTAVLQVSDSGIGISAALLPRVFDPFVQGTRTLDRSEGGLGIGLTLVKSVVELHGGTVEAVSEGAGRGARFVVRLPLAQAEAVASQASAAGSPGSSAPPPAAPPAAPPASSTARVLVVDDNEDAAETVAMLLRLNGHEVEVVHDGFAALARAAQRRPEVVFLDIGLPGMDGYEVARRLQALPGTAPMRLIAMTGYGQDKDKLAARAAGFDLHLTKPVEPGELVKLVG